MVTCGEHFFAFSDVAFVLRIMNENSPEESVKESLLKIPHLLPFKTAKPTKCRPDLYMQPLVAPDGQLSATVRGRPIRGVICNVPENHRLCLANFVNATAEGGLECKSLDVKQSYDQFALWNLSLPIDETHDLKKALTWIDVAKCVHGNDETEQSEKA